MAGSVSDPGMAIVTGMVPGGGGSPAGMMIAVGVPIGTSFSDR